MLFIFIQLRTIKNTKEGGDETPNPLPVYVYHWAILNQVTMTFSCEPFLI